MHLWACLRCYSPNRWCNLFFFKKIDYNYNYQKEYICSRVRYGYTPCGGTEKGIFSKLTNAYDMIDSNFAMVLLRRLKVVLFFFGDGDRFVVGSARQIPWFLKKEKRSSGSLYLIIPGFACFKAKKEYGDLGKLPTALFASSFFFWVMSAKKPSFVFLLCLSILSFPFLAFFLLLNTTIGKSCHFPKPIERPGNKIQTKVIALNYLYFDFHCEASHS